MTVYFFLGVDSLDFYFYLFFKHLGHNISFSSHPVPPPNLSQVFPLQLLPYPPNDSLFFPIIIVTLLLQLLLLNQSWFLFFVCIWFQG